MMTAIQEQAIEIIKQLPDYKVEALITLFSDVGLPAVSDDKTLTKKKEALKRLQQADFVFSPDFDPDKELAEALEEKYGSIG